MIIVNEQGNALGWKCDHCTCRSMRSYKTQHVIVIRSAVQHHKNEHTEIPLRISTMKARGDNA